MNNAGAIYVNSNDHVVVAEALTLQLSAAGFSRVERAPTALSGKIMIAEKRLRHFLIAPAQDGWVTIWEDPRYFADRVLAQGLAQQLAVQTVWIEVSGNEVSWARGHYAGATVLEEHYEAVETTFYGEYGVVHFAFDMEQMPEEFIARLGLPYSDLHYEAVVGTGLQPGIAPLHLAFERSGDAR